MKFRKIFLILIFFNFLYKNASSYERELVDRIIAIVNAEVLTLNDLKKEMVKLSSEGAKALYEKEVSGDEKIKNKILELLINSRLLLQEAEKLSLSVSDSEIEDHIKKIMQENNWEFEEFERAIKMLGFGGIEEYRKHAREELLKSQIVRIKVGSKINVSDREVEEAFQKKYGDALEEEIRISHILFKIPLATLEEIKEKRETAEKFREMILKNPSLFEEIAMKYSEDASAKNGGDVGYWKRGSLDAVFEEVAFFLEVGEISEVVQSSFGFHIIKVTDKRRVPIKDIDEIKARLRYELYQENFQKGIKEWIKELRNKAHVIFK